MDGVKASAARQTSCNVRTTDTAAIAVAVAVVVTVAAAVAMTATVAGGHCTPPLRLLPRPFLLQVLPPAPAPART